MTDARMETLRVLEERLASLPGQLRRTFEAVDRTFPDDTQGVLVTGGGMSEGPARLFVSLLREAGRTAFFVPLSEFVGTETPAGGDTLVLFSQGLAPNARFPLQHINQYQNTWIVTSVAPDARAPVGSAGQTLSQAQVQGAQCLVLPPPDETGLLLRVVGPAVAALGGALLLGKPGREIERIPQKYADALSSVAENLLVQNEAVPIGLVVVGRYAEACGGLSWKLLEGLQVPSPPVWDLLQVVHGPFQSFCNRAQVLLVLEKTYDAHGATLRQKLQQILTPPRHKMIVLPSDLPGALSWFAHDATLNAMLLATLRKAPRDLLEWPGKNQDGPMYDLAPESYCFSPKVNRTTS